MQWLSQDWIWLALGIGAIFLVRQGGLGCRGAGHHAHDRGRAGGQGSGEDGGSPVALASDAGRAGTAAVTDDAGTDIGARAAPPQGAPQARRRHGCC